MLSRAYFRFALLTFLLCFAVVLLGAFVRLSDAGLGCPDWPGCYGHLGVPSADEHVSAANEAYPHRPVEAHKAWKEMLHRYLAGTLGLLILALAVWATRNWIRDVRAPVGLAWSLVGIVIFQAVLGMWTVTWQLKPLAVSAHLLGGFATLALLFLLALRSGEFLTGLTARMRPLVRTLAALALGVLIAQIFLGAWTSSNYAAMACPDFPTCQTAWLPPLDYREAYTLWRGLGTNYEFGVLDNTPRVTIHFTHRLGAVLTLLFVGAVAGLIAASQVDARWRSMAVGVLAVLGLQLGIGIATVVLHLPLPVAVAHNGGAALLLLSLVLLNYAAWKAKLAS